VESLEQRLPVELFKVVEKTHAEVELRHPQSLITKTTPGKSNVALSTGRDTRSGVLNDLLTTAYAKFEAIAEAHRVFNDVVGGVSRRNGLNTSRLTRGFKELWKLYQSELRTVLHDYLSTDSETTQRSQGLTSESNVFRYQRDKSKVGLLRSVFYTSTHLLQKCAFKMDWVDSTDTVHKVENDDVVATFRKFVPGLVSFSQAQTMGSGNAQYDSSAAGHRLLVEPGVFNIEVLLPTTVTFLHRLKNIVPPGSDILISTLTSFLSDFLINVFHPQLEETLTELCSQSFLQLDAFQVDPNWNQYSQKPLFKVLTTNY